MCVVGAGSSVENELVPRVLNNQIEWKRKSLPRMTYATKSIILLQVIWRGCDRAPSRRSQGERCTLLFHKKLQLKFRIVKGHDVLAYM